jgi:hypothetical protein
VEEEPMSTLRLIVLSLALAGCRAAATSSINPSPAVAPTPSEAPMPSTSGGPEASTACIDPGQLGDTAETVVVALQGLDTSVKASNVDDERASAVTASTGLRSVADLVAARPDAEKEIAAAADDLDKAKAQFPAGLALVTDAESWWDQGLKLAQASTCAS